MHRWSRLFVPTLREAPADAEVASHKFLLRAGYIRQLGADSLDTVELVMEFEEEFDITIPDEEAEKIQTVGDAIGFITSNAKS